MLKRTLAAALCAVALVAMPAVASADTPKEIDARHDRQFAKKVLRFGGWAIPKYIVLCESGGNFHALNPSSGAGGAYQILPSTWAAYGGRGRPHTAPPKEQHIVARRIWKDVGASAWACA